MQNSRQLNPMSPYTTSTHMENSIKTLPATQQLSTQGYNAQMQPASWGGNQIRQGPQGSSVDPYSQSMSRYYQGSAYSSHQNSPDMSQYISTPNGHHAPAAYSSQYHSSRQGSYSTPALQQAYPSAIKPNYSSSYYSNMSGYPSDGHSRQPSYPTTAFYPTKTTPQCVPPSIPQSPHGASVASPCLPQTSNMKHANMQYSRYQLSNSYAGYPGENQSAFTPNQKVVASPTATAVITSASTNSQLSSIPTPPETTAQGEILCNENMAVDGIMDCSKMNSHPASSSSFVLPCSTSTHTSTTSFSSSNVNNTVSNSLECNRTQNWNGGGGVPVQPPPNVDEGSQASSASASSSIPDDQNSAKANSKPNFSYPPTPNTLSSPGAASMSSFHDDLECTSSPGWPRTPASPVATSNNNSNYEFAHIKRPESLLKLYSISDEPDRRFFLDKLIVFSDDRGCPITQCPTISKQPLDVFRVYLSVKERGGFVEVTNAKRWKDIAGAIGVGASSSAAYTLRKQYMKLLLPFECKFDRGGIDPQPIINMVEASSRKKNKNATSGNSNMVTQGYPSDGYNGAGYAEPDCYPSSRYPCPSNSVEYQCAPKPMQHHPQSMQHPTSNSVQPQYNQYNRSYSNYYQANSNHAYSNCPQPTNSPCHYPTNSASNEGNYYPSSYATQQQSYPPQTGNCYKYNSYGSQQETVMNSQTVRSEVKLEPNPSYESPSKEKISAISTPVIKHSENSLDASVNDSSISSDSNSLDNISENPSYATAKPMLQERCAPVPVMRPCPTPNPSGSPFQPHHPPVVSNKNYQPSGSSSANPSTITNNDANPAAHNYEPPTPYQNTYQPKVMHQNPSGHCGPYANSSSESYRGSEGPTSYTGYQQVKYNGAMESSEVPGSYPTPYKNNYIQKPDPYTNYPNSGPAPVLNKGQYPPGYNKDLYSSGPKPKGWNSSSPCYQYQVPDATPPVSNSPRHNNCDITDFPDQGKLAKPFSSNCEIGPVDTKMPLQPNINCIPPNRTQQPPSSVGPQPYSLFQSVKKPITFPSDSVEAVKPVFRKRRRYSGKRVSPLDPWHLMLALKSGLLVESTWALDSLAVLLCDNSCANYFRLSHLPGLLSVLVEHYRFFLNKIFDIFNELDMNGFKYNDSNQHPNSSKDGSPKKSKERRSIMGLNWLEKSKVLHSPNYTFQTRCKKNVRIRYDEALFLIDPDQKWDCYEGFNVDSDYWQSGHGEITSHIQLPMARSTGKVKFSRDMDIETSVKSEPDCDESLSEKNYPDLVEECKSKLSKLPNLLGKSEPVLLLKQSSDVDVPAGSCCDGMDNADTRDSIDTTFTMTESELQVKIEPLEVDCLTGDSEPMLKLSISPSASSSSSDTVSDQSFGLSQHSESNQKQENEGSSQKESYPRLRDSCKRPHVEELEDEAYCFDQPSLNLLEEYQDALMRRCMCVSNILRNLSFIPGNDVEMNKHSCLLLILGRLILLHHQHKQLKPTHRKYSKDEDESCVDNSCVSLKEDYEWWHSLLHVLRDNTLVILSNIAGQLDLAPYPEEISLPILDGLLHWVVCPSSYARDPLPAKPTFSVLTPQRLSLEILCKLSILDNNVDLMIATPPWTRVEHMFKFLTKALSPVQDKVVREFAIVMLSSLSQADSSVARTIANQSQCISYLIGFIEQTERSAFQIATTQGTKKLKDNPEIVGSTPGMVQRAATVLKNLAMVPENVSAFFCYQHRLLTLATSQIIDQNLASIIADVLFYCSEDASDTQSLFS